MFEIIVRSEKEVRFNHLELAIETLGSWIDPQFVNLYSVLNFEKTHEIKFEIKRGALRDSLSEAIREIHNVLEAYLPGYISTVLEDALGFVEEHLAGEDERATDEDREDMTDVEFAKATHECPSCGSSLSEIEIEQGLCEECSFANMDIEGALDAELEAHLGDK